MFLWLNIFSLYQEALYSHIFVIFWVWTLHVSFSLLRYKAHHNQYWRCIHVYECYSYLWPVVYHRLSNIHWDFPHYWTLSEIFHKFKKYHLLSPPPPPPPPPPFFVFFLYGCVVVMILLVFVFMMVAVVMMLWVFMIMVVVMMVLVFVFMMVVVLMMMLVVVYFFLFHTFTKVQFILSNAVIWHSTKI